MHELSIAQALVEQVESIVAAEGAHGVDSVQIVIGGLSGVEPEALDLAFPVAAEGTVVEGAGLDVTFAPAELVCHQCGKTSHPNMAFYICELCGGTDVEMHGGRELTLQSVELRFDKDRT